MNNKQQLLTLPENNFISSYDVAYSIVDSASESHQGLWNLIKDCQAHISGKKPVPQDTLKQKGMSWAWNFNFRKATAKIEKGVAESCATISSALALGYVTFRNSEEGDAKDKLMSFLLDEGKRGVISSAIGYAFASTLAKESRLSGWLNEVEYPSYAFGYCALAFDKFDWMPTPIHPLNIAFKPNTKPEKIRQWIIYDLIEAETLYTRWIELKQGKKAADGWQLKGLEDLLLKAFRGKLNNSKTPETWEEVIPYYEADPSSIISNTSNVFIAKIFHTELNGEITEVYIPWTNSWNVTKNRDAKGIINTNDTTDIIFKKSHGKINHDNLINIIRDSGFSSEAGCIQDMRGIARFAVEDSIRYNRLRNGIGNKMQFVGSPMFEQPTSQTGEKFKITVSQGFILLPPSHQLIERQPAFDIASHINVLKFEEGEYNRDTQQYDASIQGRLTSRPNKGEVQAVSEEVRFTEAAKNNIKLRDYSAIFKTVVKRIPSVKCDTQDVGYEGKKRFYAQIRKLIPWITKDEDVDKVLQAVDSFVLDPVVSNIETITIAIQMAETPFARNRLKRMLLIAKGFPIEEVNLAVPLIGDKFSNLNDDRVAAFENDMFFTTNEVIVSGTDDQIVHLDSHIAKSQRVIQGVQEQRLSPVDAFKYLENVIVHIAGHIQFLSEDPILNKKAQEYFTVVKDIVKSKDQIRSMAEQMMEQQQAEAQKMQLDPKTEAEIANDNAKAMSDTQRKNWLAQQRTEQKEKQMDQSHEQRMRELELKYGNQP